MKTDIVWLKLFDDKKRCRFIRPMTCVIVGNQWFLKSGKKESFVFTAHIDTVLTHATLSSELISKQFPGACARMSQVHNERVGKKCTLTIQFGGMWGDDSVFHIT